MPDPRIMNVNANPLVPQEGSAIVVPLNKITYDGTSFSEYVYWRLGRISFGENPRLMDMPRKVPVRTGIKLFFSTPTVT